MEMGGILKFLPIEEAAVAAIRAGMDMLEICHSPELILRAYEALIAEGERSVAFRTLLIERARKMSRKRARHFADGFAPALTGGNSALCAHDFAIWRDRCRRRAGERPPRAEAETA